MAAMANEPDNLFQLSEDDGSLVITCIDPTVFHDLIHEAQHGPFAALLDASHRSVPEHDLIAHDFAQAYGLLMIPPLASPVAALSFEALKEECEKRRVGVISGRIAYALARLCNARGPLATEAAFDNIVLTPQITEYLREDIAANDYDRGGTYIELNNKSERGVQNLMGALIRRWGKHVRVVGQPDEAIVTDLALSMAILQSASWEHPPRTAVEATTANIVLDQDIQFNIPGLQGLALGNKLHKSIRLSIKGLPLTGLGSRIRAYVKIESNIVTDENNPVPEVAEPDEDDETLQPYDILRDSVKGLVKLRCLVNAPQDPTDQEINNSTAISFSPLASPPTPDDMAALKQIVLSARKLESLTIKGNMENPPDGRAGAFIPASALSVPQPAGAGFYLPPFQFLPQDNFPPLLHLHLWRYDWRRHSNFDVETHWDFSRLQSLTFDGAPLRWFLGTLRMTDLRYLHSLRLEDAEWALRPLQSQQAAIIIGYILSYFVHSLRRLELIRVYTDHVPLASLRRHASTLEHVALRHPYGIGFGPGGLTPSMASRMLLSMLQRGDEVSNSMNVMAVALGGNGVVHPPEPNANFDPREAMPNSMVPTRPPTSSGTEEADESNANVPIMPTA
ncbi:f-box domain-containing protein [Ophiostoma piceae UAMH 11346]|uniref:F-box domain-containing protein n=1 Tax=Ophiostoma piceae (strain UAMH 11346) TaxID=1262450 RepID=S3BVM6_OPHP1|nr:f-box domain-containing protein [Ophiostoma piceae UAMH 11346]